MVAAYILIISESGAEKHIVEELLDEDGIEDADLVYGEYDIIAKVNIPDISMLADFILEKIRPINGIKRTSTLIVVAD